MLFSSMIFLWAFLPIVIAGYYFIDWATGEHGRFFSTSRATSIKIKNYFLLFASLIFYGFGGIPYLLLMLLVIVVDYTAGFFVAEDSFFAKRFSEEKKILFGRRFSLILALTINLGSLFIFKYLGMFADVEIALPIGISFYTFQAISYVVDVYRRKVPVQKKLSDFALYVSLFPQLIAGPIVQYKDIQEQLLGRKETLEGFAYGIKRFCYGLGKKVLIANTFATVADQIWKQDITLIGAPVAWFGMVAYTIQIYFDFSGYSDMAIGLGSMFGFHFKENFNYPYTSLSIQEFWRRWHISLSSFFKDYVYIPLGGSREGAFRTYRNLLIVFALTGIWHGANYTFWVWGMYYGLILVLERLFLGDLLKRNPVKLINWIYSIFIVMVGWVIFRSDNLAQAFTFIQKLFTPGKAYTILAYMDAKLILLFPIAVLCSGWFQRLFAKPYEKVKETLTVRLMDGAFQIFLLIASMICIAGGTYNPFIYFQF